MTDIVKVSGFNDLSPAEKESHRIKVGLRVEAILNQFWHDTETPETVKALEIEGWIDVLENCSHSEIRDAWRDYQLDPANRTARGRLAKPDAGALRAIAYAKRPKPHIVSQPEPERDPPCTPEAAAEIMAQAGFAPRKFGGDE